jgi:hypothetical protein
MTFGDGLADQRWHGPDHPRGNGSLRRGVAAVRGAIGIAWLVVLGLTIAGCAIPGGAAPRDRQAVIDRIVAASAKVMIEHSTVAMFFPSLS